MPARTVLDTSILVAGVRSVRGASNALIRHVARGTLTALATTALFLEYEAVLTRQEHLEAAGMTSDKMGAFLAALASVLVPVEVHFGWRPQLSDADDELVLEAAVNGRAKYLVTHNIRDFGAAAPRFGIEVMTPRAMLERLVA